MSEDKNKLNIVGKPSPEMTAALKRQDEIKKGTRNRQEIEDLILKIASVLGRGDYALTINDKGVKEGIEDLQARTGITVINLGRRYDFGDEPRLFMDKKGGLVDWRERFEREGHVFEEGERVAVFAFVKIDSNGEFSLVADDQDGRMADRFFPVEIPEEVKQKLEEYRGIAVGCVVRIESLINRGGQLSDIHEYNVKLEPEIVVPPINPTDEQLECLPKGARVVVEGMVVKSEVKEVIKRIANFDLKDKITYLTIQTPDSRQITVANWSDNLTYEEGNLENLRGKSMQQGELIRLTAYVDNDDEGRNIVHSHWSKPYLVEPTEPRLAEYQQLREIINREIQSLYELIKAKNYSDARRLFASIRTRELTKDESDKVIACLAGFPDEEKPIYDGHEKRLYWAESLDEAYGVLVESMTRAEFAQFAREVGSGRRSQTGKHCDASYAYLIMCVNKYDDETTLSILSNAINERLRRLEQNKGEEVEDWHDDEYMLEQSLGYLTHVKSPEVTKKIMEVIKYCMTHKYYDKRQEITQDWGCPHKFLSLLWSATDDLVTTIREHPENIDGIENLDELLAWQEELSPYPFCDNSRKNLQKITNMFRIF